MPLREDQEISCDALAISRIDTKQSNDYAYTLIKLAETCSTFKGKVMLIKDPKRVKVAVTKDLGVLGERVSDLVKDRGAIGELMLQGSMTLMVRVTELYRMG